MYPAIRNAVQFTPKMLKCVSGQLPKHINGMYLRNGVGTLNFGTNTVQNYFLGDGCILKLLFEKGQCQASVKYADTPIYKRRVSRQSFRENFFRRIWNMYKSDDQLANTANTSILFLKNSPHFLALCQGGQPFLMRKQNLQSQKFVDYGWIKSTFSAHPKVDPDNGDIFNIGFKPPNFVLMRANKDMKKICQNSFKFRQMQSIHDFCLAGDYVIVLEGPIKFNLKGFLFGDSYIDGFQVDPSLPTLIHIFSKNDLKHIKTISADPFYCFHFTNGYSNQQKIVIQYCKYDMKTSKTLFELIVAVPQFTQPNYKAKKYTGNSTLQQLTIDLSNFSIKTKQTDINVDFPVCEDSQVGKQWQYTYCVGSQIKQILNNNVLFKYDRKNQIISKFNFGQNSSVGEPCLIRIKEKLYILCIVNRDKQTYAQILQAQSLRPICKLQFPEFVPAGFHGKWEATQ